MIGQNFFKAGNVDIKAIYEKCLQKKKHEVKDFQNLEYID